MRRVLWCGLLALVLPLLTVLVAGPAAADVRLLPDHTEAGAQDVSLVFRVSNDDPADPVVGVRVELPTARPLAGVRAQAPDGWQVATTAGPGGQETGTVEWRGGPVGAEPVDLVLVVGRMPEGAGPVRFAVVQTARSGAAAVWSDRTVTGIPAPGHRSLVLPFGAPAAPPAAAGHHDHGADTARTAADSLGAPPGTASVVWTVGTVAVVALLFGLWMRVLGREQRRRFEALQASPDESAELRTPAPRDRTP
ncbi:MAG: YcnI family protein [Pseudonocardia sp.]|nr:YcnI family protein [Pseudonocardia sp.]